MAWNPSPKVADCRGIARKWKKKQVIIIAFGESGQYEMATYGETPELCKCTAVLADVASKAMENYVAAVIARSER